MNSTPDDPAGDEPPHEPGPGDQPPHEPGPGDQPPHEPEPGDQPPHEPGPGDQPPHEPGPGDQPPHEPEPGGTTEAVPPDFSVYAPPAPPAASIEPAPAPAQGPGIGIGIGTGCGLQVVAAGILVLMITLGASLFGLLWPFIVVTVAAIVLMFFRRWRRFATGILIISAATWIIVIGPCLALINGL